MTKARVTVIPAGPARFVSTVAGESGERSKETHLTPWDEL